MEDQTKASIFREKSSRYPSRAALQDGMIHYICASLQHGVECSALLHHTICITARMHECKDGKQKGEVELLTRKLEMFLVQKTEEVMQCRVLHYPLGD